MKIGILSFPNMKSYGCSLQMYALYRAVEDIGAETELINYRNEFMRSYRHTTIGRKNILAGKLRLAGSCILHWQQTKGFHRFERRMHHFPQRDFYEKSRLPDVARRYDRVICGSDQVWNPLITHEDLSFFLDFCGSQTKRISYAPSFGISEFSEEFSRKIGPELRKFDALSVREATGARYVEELVGHPVETVLDPTFLLSREEWTALEMPHPMAKGEYVCCFPLGNPSELIRIGKELAEKLGIDLVVAGGNVLTQLRNRDRRVHYTANLNPEQWLYLMSHAQCIVTNSYHGAAFAIHYRKDFYLQCKYDKLNSRLEHLMELCGIQDRIIRKGCHCVDTPIDYEKVEQRLTPARAASLAFLKRAVWE